MLADPPDYEPDEEPYAERWVRVFFSAHACFGGWYGQPRSGCACRVMREQREQAATGGAA